MTLQMVKYKWRYLLTESRFFVSLLLTIFFLDIYISPIRNFCRTVGEKISPFLYPCLIADNALLLLLLLSFLLLVSDIPFLDQSMKYIVIRSGKKAWLKAQMNYLFTISIFYMCVLWFGSILLCLPYLQFMKDWERIIGTLAQTDAGSQFAIAIQPSYEMMLSYTPLEAVLITFISGVMVLYMFCLVLFGISLYLSKVLGLCIVFGETLMVTTAWRLGLWGTYVFPVTWMQITTITKNSLDRRPVLWVTWIILLFLITLLRIVIVKMSTHLELLTAIEKE